MYEIITTNIPFGEDANASEIASILASSDEDTMLPLSDEVQQHTSIELIKIMKSCWAKTPQQRPTASELLEQIEHRRFCPVIRAAAASASANATTAALSASATAATAVVTAATAPVINSASTTSTITNGGAHLSQQGPTLSETQPIVAGLAMYERLKFFRLSNFLVSQCSFLFVPSL